MLDGPRLLSRLAELAALSAGGPGVTRLAYSPLDVAARTLVAGWAHEAGLRVTVDAAGSLVAELAGSDPTRLPLVTGSHLDTVVEAGALDGAYGLVAAVEVAAALAASGRALRHPLRVVAFSNEEGARGTPGMTGSRVIAGHPPDVAGTDDEGVSLAARLGASGGDAARIAEAAWGPVAGFVELHIEQGPSLVAAGATIGVVTAVTAQAHVEVVVTGEARHAGGTPMGLRRDAAVAAARIVIAVQELARGGAVRVATAGRVVVSPGVRNVVPGRAQLSLDLRDADDARLFAAVDRLPEIASAAAGIEGCTATVTAGATVPATPVDPALLACVADAAAGAGCTVLELPSGAGHDAQWMARLGPMAMVFVPSRDGISHAPQEWTEPAQLVAGAQVLLDALLLADERLP